MITKEGELKNLALTIVMLVSVGATAITHAQENPGGVVFGPGDPDAMKWDTYGNEQDEFHARFPRTPSVFLTRRDLTDTAGPNTARIYSSYEEGVVCIVVVFDNAKKGEPLDLFIDEVKKRFFSTWEMNFDYEIVVNTDSGKHYNLKKRDISGAARFFVKSKHS